MATVDKPGLFIAAMILIAQIEIWWFLKHDWQPVLSRNSRAILDALLGIVWAATALGLAIDLIGPRRSAMIVPRVAIEDAVGFTTAWGFASTAAINIYAVCRYLFRGKIRGQVQGKIQGKTQSLSQPPLSVGRRRAVQTFTATAMAAPFAVAAFGGIVERTAYVVNEIDLPIPNLHPDLDGVRIAQISDLHVSPFLSVREAGRVVDMTNELKPNLTLVTGDLITQTGDPLDGTIRELARLKADAGVLGCLGNHEVYAMCQAYTTRQAARYGIRFLRQDAVPLHWGQGTLNVAGVDFQRFANRSHYLPGVDRLLVPGVSNLLLSHNPDVFPTAVRAGYDAVVGGHTHGGQVTVEILNQTANLARFFTPYVAGLYRLEGRSCYVNAGIGTIGMPVRIGAPPEITLFRLRRA